MAADTVVIRGCAAKKKMHQTDAVTNAGIRKFKLCCVSQGLFFFRIVLLFVFFYFLSQQPSVHNVILQIISDGIVSCHVPLTSWTALLTKCMSLRSHLMVHQQLWSILVVCKYLAWEG